MASRSGAPVARQRSASFDDGPVNPYRSGKAAGAAMYPRQADVDGAHDSTKRDRNPFMSIPDPLLPDEPLPQRISRIFAWLAGGCILFGCGALISADVVTRFVFKRGMIESFEISGYMLAACIGLGLAFTVTSKSNIRVDILLDAFPYRLRVACDLLAAVALAVIAVALVWFAWKTLAQSWSMNARSTSIMQTPMVLPQGIWWIGLLWFAFMAILLPLQAILRLLATDQRGFDRLIGSLRVTEELEQAGIDMARIEPKADAKTGAPQK